MGLGFKGVPIICIMAFGGLYWGCANDVLLISALRSGAGGGHEGV